MQSGFKIQCPLVLDDCFNENGIISVALQQVSTELIIAPVNTLGITILEYPKKEANFIKDIEDKMQFLLHQYCKVNKVEEIGFDMKIKTDFPFEFWSQSIDPLMLFIYGINKHYKRPMEERKLLAFLQGNILTDKKCAMGASLIGGFCIYDFMHQKTHRLLSPQGLTFTLVLSKSLVKSKQDQSDSNGLINLIHGLDMSNWELIKSGFSSLPKNAFIKDVEKQIDDKEYLGGGVLFQNEGVFFVTCNSRTNDRLEKVIQETLTLNQISDVEMLTSPVNHEGIRLS